MRANYLYAGAADLYAETGNPALWTSLTRIWTNVGTMDHGGYGCETSGDGYPDNPHDGSHDERCPVAIARANLFAAMDARTA